MELTDNQKYRFLVVYPSSKGYVTFTQFPLLCMGMKYIDDISDDKIIERINENGINTKYLSRMHYKMFSIVDTYNNSRIRPLSYLT